MSGHREVKPAIIESVFLEKRVANHRNCENHRQAALSIIVLMPCDYLQISQEITATSGWSINIVIVKIFG